MRGRVRGEIVASTGLLYRVYRGYQVYAAGVAGKQDDTRQPRGRCCGCNGPRILLVADITSIHSDFTIFFTLIMISLK